MAAAVRSFLEFGLAAAPPPRRGGFEWSELHEVNQAVPWDAWEAALLARNASGQLESGVFAERALARRRTGGARTPSAAVAAAGGGQAWFGGGGGGGGGAGGAGGSGSGSGGIELAAGVGGGGSGGIGARAAAAAGAAPAAPGAAALEPAPSGSASRPLSSGGARPGPPQANYAILAAVEAAGGRMALPHSSSTAALPLPPPPPPDCAGGPPRDAPSTLLSEADARALSAALPPIHKGATWALAYSTARDGVSLHTLLRKAAGAAPSLLVVRDGRGAVFGAFATEAWHVAPRFYGTGETFVFSVGSEAAQGDGWGLTPPPCSCGS